MGASGAKHLSELFILEWSAQQKSFHIQLLDEALATNRQSFDGDRSTDWVPLFVGSYWECEMVARHNEAKLIKREIGSEWTH